MGGGAVRTPAQEKLAAAVREYLLERDGGGYYVDSIDTALPSGREVTALVRIEVAPRVPQPDWPHPQR